VYSSSDDSSALGAKISDWLGNHPFVLSSLDSKGLEFDDVVVAFDMKRKAWDLKSMVSDIFFCLVSSVKDQPPLLADV
jgi:hypothetical protein